MDITLDTIKTWLKRYEEAIDETDKNYGKLTWLGRFDPIAPYINKYNFLFMIENLDKKGVDTSEIKREYDNLNKKLSRLEQIKGNDYRNKLYEELKLELTDYSKKVNYMFDLDPICVETGNALLGRDILEILTMELKDDYNIQPLINEINEIDLTLKAKFESSAKRSILKKIIEECPAIEIHYYPERFWWRHPSKFIS